MRFEKINGLKPMTETFFSNLKQLLLEKVIYTKRNIVQVLSYQELFHKQYKNEITDLGMQCCISEKFMDVLRTLSNIYDGAFLRK